MKEAAMVAGTGLESLREALGLPVDATVEAMCERARQLRQTEMSAEYLVLHRFSRPCCPLDAGHGARRARGFGAPKEF